MFFSRRVTNVVRTIMDEFLPAIVRDNKYFMWPFYILAYRGKNIGTVMHFKSQVYKFSEQEYKKFYSEINSISRNRLTDLNNQCIDFIADQVNENIHEILDVGCSSGYLLKYLHNLYPEKSYTGCDIVEQPECPEFKYIQSDIQNLDIKDNRYDLVLCCHTLEHVLKLNQAVRELVRICRKKLIIVVPCQRYYYYTLDEHINFFTCEYQLQTFMGIDPERIVAQEKLWGDWVLVVDCEKQ